MFFRLLFQGFDVDFVHGGNILPMNINVKNEYVDYERYSKLAVSEYNRRFKVIVFIFVQTVIS